MIVSINQSILFLALIKNLIHSSYNCIIKQEKTQRKLRIDLSIFQVKQPPLRLCSGVQITNYVEMPFLRELLNCMRIVNDEDQLFL